MVRVLVEFPRWLLLASLVFAPWAYGSTRPWAIQGLGYLLTCVVVVWMIECVARRRWPGISWMVVALVTGLLAQGWWMTLNAHSRLDAGLGALVPEMSLVAQAPGSADGTASMPDMVLETGLLGALLFCCDLTRHPVWLRRIWTTMALTGISLAAFGVAQKIGGMSVLGLVWEPEKIDPASNFAMFRYRGNAGAFLNLLFPLAGALTFLAFARRDRPWRMAFWSAGLFVLLVGIQLNPSRASWVIALMLGLAMAVRMAVDRCQRRHRMEPDRFFIRAGVIALLLLVVLSISALGHWETSWSRFSVLGFDAENRAPVEIYLHMAPDAGALGFGPGTFSAVFEPYQRSYDFGARTVPAFWKAGFFVHAHEDYLETFIEWGWLGALLWSGLLVGGIASGVRQLLDDQLPSTHRLLLFGSLLALGGVLLHALVDFPLEIASIRLYVLVLLGTCWCTTKGRRSSRVRSTIKRSYQESSRQ